MAKFKQDQIIAGVTKTRSNALKVYCGAAIAANDIIVATGMQGDFLSVVPADNTDLTKCRGPFFVADFAGASGEYLPLALPYKVVTSVDTSDAAQVGDAVYLSTGGDVTLGAIPGTTANAAVFALNVRVGRITKVDSSAGAYVLEPSAANGAPLTGRSLGNASANVSATVAGFTAELGGAPVIVQSQGASDRSVIRVFVHTDGVLTMEFSGTVTDTDILNYTIFA